jgi:hypothetical protein
VACRSIRLRRTDAPGKPHSVLGRV